MRRHVIRPTREHVAFMDDMKAVLANHVHLSAKEMLALASQFVGNLTALQDQRTMTSETVMAIVASNIEIGNQAAIDGVMQSEGSA